MLYVIARFNIVRRNIIELLYVCVQLPTRRGKRAAVYFGTPLKNTEIIKPLVIKRSYSMRFRFPTYRSSQAHFSFLHRRLLYNFSFAEQPVCFDMENAQAQRFRLVVFSKRLQTNISFTARRTNRNILSICHNGIPVRPQRIVKSFERFYIFICEYAVYVFA